MSRAAAVAYDTQTDVDIASAPPDLWPGRTNTESYRLLGDGSSELFGAPRLLALEAELDWSPAEVPGYLDQEVEMPGAYFTAQRDLVRASRSNFASHRLLLGLVVALLLAVALMLVTPVFAGARFGAASRAFSLSGYSDLAAGSLSSQAPAGQNPAIDVTSAPAAAEAAPPPAPVAAQSGHYSLIAPPSTSVRQIEEVLKIYGSPAAGQGQLLYDLGVKYGIDPSYALAFFVHESGCGTRGVARFTSSLGNIRWTDGFENYEGYRKYSSWQAGFEDWYRLITDLYISSWGLRTVDAIIPVYAPAADNNNPAGYISAVKASVDSWRGK